MAADKHRRADETVAKVVQEISDREPRVQRARARYEMARRAVQVITSLCAVAAVAILIYLAGSANAGAEAIQDCTTPGGACYERSQAQSAALVGQIVESQQKAVQTGSAPSRENLALTKQNAANLALVLAILDREYPEAAAAVRRELGVKNG
jgi:hypothetical protein